MAIVVLTTSASMQADALPLTIRARILQVIERLEKWPNVSGVKPLRGKLAGRYRMRTGDYRIQFYLSDESIVIEQIGHRDGFYESA